MRTLILTINWILFLSTGFANAETNAISLNDYLKLVEAKNLMIATSQAALQGAEARAVGIKLPEPMVSLSQMSDSNGSANGFEVSQTIPFPSKLTSEHKARSLESKMEYADSLRVTNEVLAKARLLYISTWIAEERTKLLQEKYDVIKHHLKLAQASTRSDSSFGIHALKAESDMDLVESEILEAKQFFAEKQINFAEYGRQDPKSYRPFLEAPDISTIPSAGNLSTPNQLEVKRLNVEMYEARSSRAQSEWLPDLNFKYREFGGGTTMMSRTKEIMLSATLPFIFFWEPRAASRSAQADSLKAKANFDEERLSISAKVAALTARAESLKKQLELINGKLIPRAEKRWRLIRNLAPRDMESLQDHREGMEVFPDLKIKSLNLRLQYEVSVAELLNYVSGEKR